MLFSLPQGDFFLPEDELLHLRRRTQVQRQASRVHSIAGGVTPGAHPLSRIGSLRERFVHRWSSASISPNQHLP